MSQPGYPGGPYPPDNNPQQPGWGAGAPNNQPPPEQYGQPPQGGFPGQPTSGTPGVPPTSGPGFGDQQRGPGFGEQQSPPPTSGPGFGEQPPPAGPTFGAPPPPGPFPPDQPGGEGPQHTMPLPTMGPGSAPPANRFASPSGERRKGPWLPVLAAVAAVFLVLAATMTVLYVGKNGDYNEQQKLASSRQQTINSLNGRINKLNDQLDDVKAERDKAKQDLSGAKNQNEDLTKERDTIGKCLTLLEDALSAASKGQDGKVDKLLDQLQKPCNEADAYLGN